MRRQSRKRKEPVVKNITTYVGVDAHKKDLVIAMLVGGAKLLVPCGRVTKPGAAAMGCDGK